MKGSSGTRLCSLVGGLIFVSVATSFAQGIPSQQYDTLNMKFQPEEIASFKAQRYKLVEDGEFRLSENCLRAHGGSTCRRSGKYGGRIVLLIL